jgi:tartrate dehydratase beta subunit/fumarate hydratase class I family protein
MRHATRSAAPLIATLVLILAAWCPSLAWSQETSRSLVSIYHVAPGKHLEFLRWQAVRDAAAAEAGIGATQWYVHMDGDSWDFVSIAPTTTEAQDDKVDAILKSKKLTTGYKAALEFRTMIASHTDTYASGPTTAAALVEAAGK